MLLSPGFPVAEKTTFPVYMPSGRARIFHTVSRKTASENRFYKPLLKLLPEMIFTVPQAEAELRAEAVPQAVAQLTAGLQTPAARPLLRSEDPSHGRRSRRNHAPGGHCSP